MRATVVTLLYVSFCQSVGVFLFLKDIFAWVMSQDEIFQVMRPWTYQIIQVSPLFLVENGQIHRVDVLSHWTHRVYSDYKTWPCKILSWWDCQTLTYWHNKRGQPQKWRQPQKCRGPPEWRRLKNWIQPQKSRWYKNRQPNLEPCQSLHNLSCAC